MPGGEHNGRGYQVDGHLVHPPGLKQRRLGQRLGVPGAQDAVGNPHAYRRYARASGL